MAYLIGLCISLILAADAVSAKCDIFNFGIPDTGPDTADVNTKCDVAEKNLCLYVGLNCKDNTNITRPKELTNDTVIQNIVDMLVSAETYFHDTAGPKDFGSKLYNSENGKKVLGLFLDSPKTKELIRKRSTPCFSNIKQKFETIIRNNSITQNFNEFVTSPFDDKHCVIAKEFNNFIQSSSNNIADCDSATISIVFDVFEDVRVHLNNCTLPEPVVPDDPKPTKDNSSSSRSSGRMILGFSQAILLSLILVKIY